MRLSSLALVLCVASVAAWRDLGHMTVAKLAKDKLGARYELVEEILSWNDDFPDLGLTSMTQAAVWPDYLKEIRGAKDSELEGFAKMFEAVGVDAETFKENAELVKKMEKEAFKQVHFKNKNEGISCEDYSKIKGHKVTKETLLKGLHAAVEQAQKAEDFPVKSLKELDGRLNDPCDMSGLLEKMPDDKRDFPSFFVDGQSYFASEDFDTELRESGWYLEHLFPEDSDLSERVKKEDGFEKNMRMANVIVRLLIHVLGDMHQPMHAINYLWPEMRILNEDPFGKVQKSPRADIGGNKVMWAKKGGLEAEDMKELAISKGGDKAKKIKGHLHDFWDHTCQFYITPTFDDIEKDIKEKAGSDSVLDDMANKVKGKKTSMKDYTAAKSALEKCWENDEVEELRKCLEALINQWADESTHVAVSEVYPMALKHGKYGILRKDEKKYTSVIYLDAHNADMEEYATKGKKIAFAQIHKAGQRLAAVLEVLVQSPGMEKLLETKNPKLVEQVKAKTEASEKKSSTRDSELVHKDQKLAALSTASPRTMAIVGFGVVCTILIVLLITLT
jgi:hypothetical protein